MGGGGRQNWRGHWITEPRELIEDAESETEERLNATEVENHLSEVLKEINAHDYEAIDSHRSSIRDALEKDFEVEQINFGGSHARSTDVSGLSDVDMLVVLGGSSDMPTSSDQVISSLAQRLEQRFPQTTIQTGSMAVTVKFSDGLEVQILPAYRSGDVYRIPDRNSSNWVQSNPTAFSRRLTSINEKCNGSAIPAIKLIKSLCSKSDIELKSYHIENMAMNTFERYGGPYSYAKMLRQFFSAAKTQVHLPISDPSGQSNDVSAYLSRADRNQLSHKLARLESTLQSNSLDNWKELF